MSGGDWAQTQAVYGWPALECLRALETRLVAEATEEYRVQRMEWAGGLRWTDEPEGRPPLPEILREPERT